MGTVEMAQDILVLHEHGTIFGTVARVMEKERSAALARAAELAVMGEPVAAATAYGYAHRANDLALEARNRLRVRPRFI